MGDMLSLGRVLAILDDEEWETAISGLQFAIDYVERREGDIESLQHPKMVLAKMKRYRRDDTWPPFSRPTCDDALADNVEHNTDREKS
jgi:hypothetical protein